MSSVGWSAERDIVTRHARKLCDHGGERLMTTSLPQIKGDLFPEIFSVFPTPNLISYLTGALQQNSSKVPSTWPFSANFEQESRLSLSLNLSLTHREKEEIIYSVFVNNNIVAEKKK